MPLSSARCLTMFPCTTHPLQAYDPRPSVAPCPQVPSKAGLLTNNRREYDACTRMCEMPRPACQDPQEIASSQFESF